MAFMQRQVVKGNWLRVETTQGTEFVRIPDHGLGPRWPGYSDGSFVRSSADMSATDRHKTIAYIHKFTKGIPQSWITSGRGYGARFYDTNGKDCTPWTVFTEIPPKSPADSKSQRRWNRVCSISAISTASFGYGPERTSLKQRHSFAPVPADALGLLAWDEYQDRLHTTFWADVDKLRERISDKNITMAAALCGHKVSNGDPVTADKDEQEYARRQNGGTTQCW